MELTEEFIEGLKIDEVAIMDKIASELAVRTSQVSAVISLVAEGCTVPFISRYRKERTGSLDEVQVRDSEHKFETYKNLEERRIEVIRGIFALGKLSEELYGNLRKAQSLTEIEDIWLPFKKKKKTRGMLAQERGLEPLAEIMLSEDEATVDEAAPRFVKEVPDKPELGVANEREAIQGAMDIIAERLSQDPDNRAAVKKHFVSGGRLVVKGVGDEDKKAKSTYQMYWDYAEPLNALKPHRVLAINRGEREGELETDLEVDMDGASSLLQSRVRVANRYHREAIDDGLRRLLGPAVLREIRTEASDFADGHGIDVFSENLKNLLMQPPIKGTRVLGIDPGIRTGTKCAALDETGKFLDYFMIFQERDPAAAKKAVAESVKKHGLKLVAVGNGTASHETQLVVAAAIEENGLDCEFTVVDEDGASVYSASDVAREEFPELDLTIRGAISIGRRLQDPLAELVKIDPKSIGVGLYQHDVNQKRLSETLDEVVGSVVNRVGVNLNTASHSLLKYVSGINTGLAKKIVKFREAKGRILSRDTLREIPGLGDKTFEQCAGFLKIPESPNLLDNTWVHPENYALAQEILELVRSGSEPNGQLRGELKKKYEVGDTTLNDIVAEIKKPNRDPRDNFPKPVLQKGVVTFEDLAEGMKVTGKVKNVVDFGAFIEIGIKESALIHVSEMSDRFVKDPMEVLKVGDVREFRIISLDPIRRRIGLSLKSEGRTAAPSQTVRPDHADRGGAEQRPSAQGPQGSARPERRAPGASPAQRPAGHDRAAAGERGDHRRDAAFSGAKPRREERPSPRDDDGMTYNPFAELLKSRGK
ncbi:MAG TPA: Tex family protein [Rectinemataceae bacterium]|nr:Tex family protein [Rectinemataceae bacterium]